MVVFIYSRGVCGLQLSPSRSAQLHHRYQASSSAPSSSPAFPSSFPPNIHQQNSSSLCLFNHNSPHHHIHHDGIINITIIIIRLYHPHHRLQPSSTSQHHYHRNIKGGLVCVYTWNFSYIEVMVNTKCYLILLMMVWVVTGHYYLHFGLSCSGWWSWVVISVLKNM